jgi:hypothetical protein
LLLQFIGTIRDCDIRVVLGVVNQIRNNASLKGIRQHFAQGPDFADIDIAPTGNQKNQSKYIEINRLSDIPIFEVPAHPWTSITNDNAFVSHLISLYFTWQQPISNWVDRDLFLRDMRSRSLTTLFCSQLLVNSMLAVACVSFWFRFLELHFWQQ